MAETFGKYRKHGDYHWRFFYKRTKYRAHALKVVNWVTEGRILDIGAGDGLITFLLGAKGIDMDPHGVEISKSKGVDVIMGNAYELPYKDNEFDAVTMFDVLEHFEFPDKALEEARRVAPIIYISTPIRGIEPGKKMESYHFQEWTPDELVAFMKSCGYSLDGTIETYSKTQYGKFKRT